MGIQVSLTDPKSHGQATVRQRRVEDSRMPPCWIGQVEEEEQGDRKKVKGREEKAKAHQGPPEVPLGA